MMIGRMSLIIGSREVIQLVLQAGMFVYINEVAVWSGSLFSGPLIVVNAMMRGGVQ